MAKTNICLLKDTNFNSWQESNIPMAYTNICHEWGSKPGHLCNSQWCDRYTNALIACHFNLLISTRNVNLLQLNWSRGVAKLTVISHNFHNRSKWSYNIYLLSFIIFSWHKRTIRIQLYYRSECLFVTAKWIYYWQSFLVMYKNKGVSRLCLKICALI